MRTYIWTLPTRTYHWLQAIGFTAAYILSDFDNLKNLHFAFGTFVGTLIIFRILFGFFGPTYSRFRDFPIGLKNLKKFIASYFSKEKLYAGHNPLASIIMLLILLAGLLCSLCGFTLYATENNILNIGINADFLEETHELLANLFLILIIFHLIGILGDVLFHRETGTIQSIFTGYKSIESKNAVLNNSHKVFVVIWLIIPVIIFYLASGLQINDQDHEKRIDKNGSYKYDND